MAYPFGRHLNSRWFGIGLQDRTCSLKAHRTAREGLDWRFSGFASKIECFFSIETNQVKTGRVTGQLEASREVWLADTMIHHHMRSSRKGHPRPKLCKWTITLGQSEVWIKNHIACSWKLQVSIQIPGVTQVFVLTGGVVWRGIIVSTGWSYCLADKFSNWDLERAISWRMSEGWWYSKKTSKCQ